MQEDIKIAAQAIKQAITAGEDFSTSLVPVLQHLATSENVVGDIGDVVRVIHETVGVTAATEFGKALRLPSGALFLLADAMASGKEVPVGEW
jgi:hypothetical protein